MFLPHRVSHSLMCSVLVIEMNLQRHLARISWASDTGIVTVAQIWINLYITVLGPADVAQALIGHAI